MTQPSGHFERHVFDRSVWTEPLFKFAQVSRLVVSLYDRHGKRWCGPCFNHPLAAHMAKAGIWDDAGWGSGHERALVQRCVMQNEPVHERVFDLFGQLAVPCKHEGQVMLVLVLGWMHQSMPESAALGSLAEQLQVPLPELWRLLRIMPPIPEKKLRAHGQMLETFSSRLWGQVLIQKQTHRQTADLKILNDAAFGLAGATTEQEICQIAQLAVKGLIHHGRVAIKLNPAVDAAREAALMAPVSTVPRPVCVPIFGSTQDFYGHIEITLELGASIEFFIEPLTALADHVGLALQKARWLSGLETERRVWPGASPEIKRLHQVKDEFLATVAQDLKMPLSAIMSWVNLLGNEGQRPLHDALQKIERSARHQSRLIEDLLDISRITSGQLSLRKQDIDAAALLTTTLEGLTTMIEARQQTLRVTLPDQPIRLHGDGDRLQQVLWNLVSNASKFTPDGGRITVMLENQPPYVRFEISDSGQGLAAAAVVRLFDGFHRGPRREPGSLGLGLTLVKHLVELHGGSVAVKSAGEGHGTTFTVLLPQTCVAGEGHQTDSYDPGHSAAL